MFETCERVSLHFIAPILHFLSRYLSLSSTVYLGLLSNRPALRLQQNKNGNVCLISSMFCLTPEWLFYLTSGRLWLSRTIALWPAPGENGRVYFCCSFSSQGLKFGFYWLVCVKLCFSVCISAFRLITECDFFSCCCDIDRFSLAVICGLLSEYKHASNSLFRAAPNQYFHLNKGLNDCV